MARSTQPPEGDSPTPQEAADMPGLPADEPALEELTKSELEDEAAARGITDAQIDGSGQDGRVVKADLVDAITDTPPPTIGRPPLITVAESAASFPTRTED